MLNFCASVATEVSFTIGVGVFESLIAGLDALININASMDSEVTEVLAVAMAIFAMLFFAAAGGLLTVSRYNLRYLINASSFVKLKLLSAFIRAVNGFANAINAFLAMIFFY